MFAPFISFHLNSPPFILSFSRSSSLPVFAQDVGMPGFHRLSTLDRCSWSVKDDKKLKTRSIASRLNSGESPGHMEYTRATRVTRGSMKHFQSRHLGVFIKFHQFVFIDLVRAFRSRTSSATTTRSSGHWPSRQKMPVQVCDNHLSHLRQCTCSGAMQNNAEQCRTMQNMYIHTSMHFCIFINLSTNLSINLYASLHVSIHLYTVYTVYTAYTVYTSIHLSIYLSVYLSAYLSINHSIYLSFYHSILSYLILFYPLLSYLIVWYRSVSYPILFLFYTIQS